MRLTSFLTVIVTFFASTASAAESSIGIAADEVFLDHRTGRFGDRLKVGYAAENVNMVAVIAPEKAEVTLAYWPEGGDNGPCPDATPEPLEKPSINRFSVLTKKGVVIRAGAPTGPVANYGGVPSQKSVIRVAPLRVGIHYCFHLNIKASTPLNSKDKAEVDSALDATVRYLSKIEPESPKTRAGTCPGIPTNKDYQKGTLTPAQIAAIFRCELGWPGNAWKVVVPGDETSTEIDISSALATFIDKDDKLRAALLNSWDARHSALVARSQIEAELPKMIESLPKWPADTLVIDPLQRLTASGSVVAVNGKADIQARLGNDKELKSAFTDAVVADPDQLLAAIYKHREVLKRLTGVQNVMKNNDKKAILEAIFEAKKEPKRFRLVRDDVDSSLEKLQAGLNDQKVRAVEIAKLRMLSHELKTVENEPGTNLSDPLHKAADAAVFSIFSILALNDNWDSNEDIAAGFITAAPYLRFRDAIIAVRREIAVGGYQTAPTYIERFPFYVSGDVGVLVGFLQRKDADSVTDVSSYFGLNIYLTPVDKEEELGVLFFNKNPWDARTFFRRFALTAGISLTKFKRRDDLGVNGVIGDQLFMFGAGFRVTDYFRLSGGGILFSQTSPNPLNDETTLRVAPYAALSADLDVFTEVKKLYTKASQ